MRKEKLRKNGLCFITGCFIKLFKTIIISSAIIAFCYRDDARNIKRRVTATGLEPTTT